MSCRHFSAAIFRPVNLSSRPGIVRASPLSVVCSRFTPLLAAFVLLLIPPALGQEAAIVPSPALPKSPRSLAGSHAGEARTIAGLPLRWCPPGQFRMGSPPDELGRRNDEGPVEVTLSRGFWIGQYEVTQAQWRRLMGEVSREL